MEVLEAFDLTGSYRDAAELAGCSHHTVARYVTAREAGGQLDKAAARPQLIDEFLPKVAEWVLHSRGKIRADKAHEKLRALGYAGSERTTRRAVHQAKIARYTGAMTSSWARRTATTGAELPTAYSAMGSPMFPALT